MTSDDVVRLAKEARFETVDILANHWKELHRFAALVAAAEREACAKVCDLMEQQAEGTECCKWPTPIDCATAIRARKDKQ